MDLFQKLGAEIEDAWRATNYNENDFPAIAVDRLKAAALPSKISAWDVLDWSTKQLELPPQRDLQGKFGDPPITLFCAPRFHIALYFWFEGTTTIHQHAFCGAFQVLLGSSIHSWYDFECRQVINTFTEIGDISLKVCELLKVGDMHAIYAGRQYIHSLFHLDQPSATIVVRTDKSPLHLPQFDYRKPNLAIDPFFEHPTSIKKMQVFTALYRARYKEADRIVNEFLESSDLQTTFNLLSKLRKLLNSDPLNTLFKIETPQKRFAGFLDIAQKRHGAVIDTLRPVFEHADMVEEIQGRRKYVTSSDHRFFMALLLNIEGRDRVFPFIKERFPDNDPVEKVLEWVSELTQKNLAGFGVPNAIGIPNFGNAELFALEHLLRGKSDDEIKTRFAAENPDADPQVIEGALAKVRNAVIFRPLLCD